MSRRNNNAFTFDSAVTLGFPVGLLPTADLLKMPASFSNRMRAVPTTQTKIHSAEYIYGPVECCNHSVIGSHCERIDLKSAT